MQPAEPCKEHIFALHQSGQRKYVACMTCGAPKPPEPDYFTERGEADRSGLFSTETQK